MTAKEAYERSSGITTEVDSIIAMVRLSVNLGEYKTVIDHAISSGAKKKIRRTWVSDQCKERKKRDFVEAFFIN